MFESLGRLRADDAYDRWASRTGQPLLVLALAFLVVLVAPLVFPEMSARTRFLLRSANVLIWLAFACDYAVKLALAPDRRLFVRRHIPELIVVAIPLLRPLQAASLLRLLRLVSLSAFIGRLARRSLHVRASVYTGLVAILVLMCGAVTVLRAERDAPGATITSFADALWWSLTTATTVGYGDLYPVTPLGRVVGGGVMLAGIVSLGVVTASLAAWFVRRIQTLEQGRQGFEQDLEESTRQTSADVREVIAELRALGERVDRLERAVAAADRLPTGRTLSRDHGYG